MARTLRKVDLEKVLRKATFEWQSEHRFNDGDDDLSCSPADFMYGVLACLALVICSPIILVMICFGEILEVCGKD